MVIIKAPFRVSFFGGGTDFPAFYNEHGGMVVSSTIDKYCYVQMRHLPPFFDYSIELSYARKEKVNSIEEIEHPSIREAMRYMDMSDLILNYDADLPARSGLGTSSSFATAMLMGFHALKGLQVDKRTLANEAIKLERELCRESGGIQDQIAASYGGMNEIVFSRSGYAVKPIIMSAERLKLLNERLMLLFTGFSRMSHEIQKVYEQNIGSKTAMLLRMMEMAQEGSSLLQSGDLDDFGRLMHEAWQLKKSTSPSATNSHIDDAYQRALNAGALGGKILGAGGGGFLLLYTRPETRENIKKSLERLRFIPFRFENHGTHIIHYSREEES